MTQIQLNIGGSKYTGWQRITVVRSIEALAGRFEVDLTDNSPFEIPQGTEVEVFLYGERVINGYVDNMRIITTDSENIVNITGRDKTGDLYDCAALVESQELLNVTLRDIIEEVIEPFSISAIFEEDPQEAFKKFSFQEETCFEAIERACRLRGLLPSSTTDGDIIIQKYGTIRAGEGLTEGENVLSCESSFSLKDRFSVYKVFGQQPSSEDTISAAAAASPQGEARDLAVERYRPKIIIAEGPIDDATAQDRAEWEATVAAARAKTVRVSVQGWKNANGSLWRENRLVTAYLPTSRIEGDMLIKEVSFSIDDRGGEKTSLLLIRPDAYEKQPDLEAEEIGLANG